MGSKSLLLPAVIFVLGVSLLGFALFSAFQPSETFTGKVTNAVVSRESANNGGASVPEKATGICVNNACNPFNSMQICAGGQWVNCPNDEVCDLGECIVPVSVGPSTKKVVYSGGGDGGGGGESTVVTTSIPVQPETTSSLGVVEDIAEIKAKENERITFAFGGAEQSIKILSISPTSAATQLGNGQSITFNIGDEQTINTGTENYSLKLDSINLFLKEARFLVTKKN